MLSSNRSAAGRLAWRQKGDRELQRVMAKQGLQSPHTHTHFIEVLAHQKSQKTSIFKITILNVGEKQVEKNRLKNDRAIKHLDKTFTHKSNC